MDVPSCITNTIHLQQKLVANALFSVRVFAKCVSVTKISVLKMIELPVNSVTTGITSSA
jgi:hypothetical protein